jgi:hypothetical protein
LQVHAEYPLRRRKSLFSGKPRQPVRRYRVLVVLPCPTALLFVLLGKPELAERIPQLGRRGEKFSSIQFAAPESANSVFFDNPSERKRAGLAVISAGIEQPFLAEDNISVGIS